MSEQKIPAPILDNLQRAAALDIVAAAAKREAGQVETTITRLEAQLEAARKAHADLGRREAEADEDAAHYREMVYGRAQFLNLPHSLVDAADKAAQKNAQPQPPEPGPNDVRRIGHSTCLHCGVQIARDASDNGPWVHHFTLNTECRDVPGKHAEPVPVDDPLGQNGAAGQTRPEGVAR